MRKEHIYEAKYKPVGFVEGFMVGLAVGLVVGLIEGLTNTKNYSHLLCTQEIMVKLGYLYINSKCIA